MLFTASRLRLAILRACSLGIAAAWMAIPASGATEIPDHIFTNLPDLNESEAPAPGYFDLEEDSASIGYETRAEKWGARVDQYMDLQPAVTMDYGLLLTNSFSAGGTFTRQTDYAEIILNGIYAPKRNLRFRMTGAQLRTSTDYLALPDAAASTFMQNSYLFGAKKYWDKYQHLSDIGIAAYSVRADMKPSVRITHSEESDLPDAGDVLTHDLAPGRLDGYMLNLGLRPTPLSKLELRRESGSLRYAFDEGFRRSERLVSNRIKYSHYIGNCMRVQGGYSASSDFDRLDLKLTKNNWNIRVSRELDAGVSDTAIHFGYMLPLGTRGSEARDCGNHQDNAPSFEPIMDAAIKRPQQLLLDPLFTETR